MSGFGREMHARRLSGGPGPPIQEGSKGLELRLTARTDSLRKRFFLYLVPLFSITPLAVAGQNTTKPGSWSGVLVSSSCNADEAFAESPECTKNVPGAKLSLYDDTIRIASIELMSIGVAVGQKAPAFSARDQFGRVQTLDSLKGTNGTVLLFFRSADW
jgi:hypothetical protein